MVVIQSEFETEHILLKYWFDTYYQPHEQKYRRLIELGLTCDDGSDPYTRLIALFEDAEIKRKRIQELEVLIKAEKED